MLNILFWNVSRRDLRPLVAAAALHTNADVVILIENVVSSEESLESLRVSASRDFSSTVAVRDRFHVFSRRRELGLEEVYDGDRLSIRQLRYSGQRILLGAIHVVDSWNWNEVNQLAEVVLLMNRVRDQEVKQRHHRTILIGDFNMNPYAPAMNAAAGFNALMTRQCVRRGHRTVQNRKYPFFYNPMWSFLGEREAGPSGTYYFTGSSRGLYGWNTLDQVLIRPALLNRFAGVEILTRVGPTLLGNELNRPNRTTASDHYPILLTLR